ncbi:MAG TPA: endonuclease, partial [Pseudoneobacillus sp.]|nr:endonuclease [Pseudoneobacillus sp.]
MERIYNSKGSFSFMTWNLYLGTDLTPILNSTNAHYPLHVTEVFLQFLITNFHRRVKEIANEIASKQPDIIGLQEAENFRLSSIANRPFISYDYVDMLLSELRKKGIYYDIAVQNDNFSMQLPLGNGNIHFLDRDVLLIRKASGLKVIRRKAANYTTNLTIKVNGKSFRVLRGWSSVDVKAKGQTFRVINTHLDANSQKLRAAQGNELLNGPA